MFEYDNKKFETYKAMILYKSFTENYNGDFQATTEKDKILTEEDILKLWDEYFKDKNIVLVPKYKVSK